MKKAVLMGLLMLIAGRSVFAQVGGGAISRESSGNPAQNERNKRLPVAPGANLSPEDRLATFIDAGVLINVKADEYVAVFALSQQEKTAADADTKINANIAAFKAAVKRLGIKESDIFVDFVLQNRVYTFEVDEKLNSAKEKLLGFELKKNVSIRFQNKALLDQLTSSASRLGIYDLVKVDYIVKDIPAIQLRLQTETTRILQAKLARYQNFGVKSLAAAQIVVDSPSIYYPLANYASYQAAQSNSIDLNTNRYTTESALKPSTFYFNPLDGNGFDLVINPVILEPVVQFTSYVKVKCSAPKP